jgi:hypothetical protein
MASLRSNEGDREAFFVAAELGELVAAHVGDRTTSRRSVCPSRADAVGRDHGHRVG